MLVASASVKRRRLPSKIRNPSVDLNDIQGPKKSPLPSNAFIRTGWLANLAIEVPRPNPGMFGLGDKLFFNDERLRTAI